MSNPYAPSGSGRSSSGHNDDGWGPATSVRAGQDARSSSGNAGANSAWGPTTNRSQADNGNPWAAGNGGNVVAEPRGGRRNNGHPGNGHGNGRQDQRAGRGADPWAPAGPVSASEQRATRKADRNADQQPNGARRPRDLTAVPKRDERGLPWWAALIVLVVVAALGGLIDTVGSFQVKGGFNIGIVVASIIAILVVKRSHMFPVVIAPPIVYSLAAVFQLYIRSGGLHDKKVVFDAAANYLVYGFPAIAAATAAVLIIAGIRLIARK